MVEKKTKVVDKWKMKSWYSVVAPENFESREIGQIVSSDEANLINRVVKIGLSELLGTFSQATAYTAVFFRVREVKGKTAHTIFIGHELVPGYLRTLARRRRSIINQVEDVVTRDGVRMRLKAISISGLKISESTRVDVRKAVSNALRAIAKETDAATLTQEMVFGKLSAKLYGAIKKLGPMKRVEIRKSEVKESFAQK
jgi:small subunit ribosomal protein S3Ae